MSKKVACVLVNYNMPERADALAEAVLSSRWDVDLVLVDNGSDIVKPAKNTTIRLPKNIQTTNGWLEGVRHARKMGNHFAYVFMITSAEPVSGDFISDCAELLANNENAVGAHPALTPDSTTLWEHMKYRDGVNRRTWMLDNICSMYKADFFDAHPFDPDLIYGHGIDLEICYHARKEGRSLWIVESSQVKKVTDIGYSMRRMNMTAEERRRNGFANMSAILTQRYGPDFWNFLTRSYLPEGMK